MSAIRSRDLIAGVRATPEDEELIRFRGKPDEVLLRFRHRTPAGELGPFRRVKVTLDVIDEALARCAKEFG